ncbi:YjjG family noncanonical pyrimidine nucleotidase [Rhodohalobacter sp. 614A]|uniref:YjjG family noncanonical pyrimidine nucleotidase n=1 Tax=Rhodohalobacter sp. 614A TaxID=2908649 RepID=UPI001F343997|nr:YjjG family noncanonical pyrimidine nucleotidase [Rhodohalobacter sp. 614A]
MNPRFVFFDLDNTLLDHNSAEAAAHNELYHSTPELQEITLDDWLNTYKSINHQLWLRYQEGDIDRHGLQRLRFHDSMVQLGVSTGRSDEIGSAYMQFYRNHWEWVDGAKEALEKVSQTFPIGIVTNGFLETQQKKIEKMGLGRHTDLFIITEEIGVMKPHPRVFDVATERAGVDRESILYVGDSYSSDIIGGRNAGWNTAWFTALVSEIEEGQSADFQFDNFDDLLKILHI